MHTYVKVGLFFLIYMIARYQSCDMFPGTIPNGRRQRFCRMTQEQFITTVALVLFMFFLFLEIMPKMSSFSR